MPPIQLKDLRITYRTLSKVSLPVEVPQELLIALANLIRDKERTRLERRVSRMTDEALSRYHQGPKHRFRVNLPDGRIVHERRMEETFYSALRLVPFAQLLALGLQVRGRDLFVGFDQPRLRLAGYKRLCDGCFVLAGLHSNERLPLLQRIDEALRLNWDFESIY